MANVYPTCTYQENWGSYQEVRMTNMPNGARAEAETVCNKIKYINSGTEPMLGLKQREPVQGRG